MLRSVQGSSGTPVPQCRRNRGIRCRLSASTERCNMMIVRAAALSALNRALSFLLLLVPLRAGLAAERWQTLPPTPAPVASGHAAHANVNGISLFYTDVGHGSPVVVLH